MVRGEHTEGEQGRMFAQPNPQGTHGASWLQSPCGEVGPTPESECSYKRALITEQEEEPS